jgi:hypothetical protein
VVAAVEHAYAYTAPTRAELGPEGAELGLATSGGVAAHPRLFRGRLSEPATHAAALLAVARCARASFFDPARTFSDPVVTCHADRLRFEALSSCASVYARHDAQLSGADGEVVRVGVTNVDVNEDTRALLARVGAGSWLGLDVGDDGLEITSDGGLAIERRVALPVRWVKGFGEVGVAARALAPAFELPGVVAQRFLRTKAPRGRGLYLAPGARWSATAGPGTVAVNNPERLRLLEPLTRFATSLRVWSGAGSISGFTLELGAAGHFTLVLSPGAARGFSGEGGTLAPLATGALAPEADDLALDLAFQPRLRGNPEALDVLAARGRAGYDLEAGAHFHRDLPYDLERVELLHPRLRDARKLVAAGEVRVDGDATWVGRQRVRGETCTCEWWGRYQGGRGPCKHVIAAGLVRERV